MAKDNLELAGGGALVHERRRVMGEGEGGGTRVLEEGGVNRALARVSAVEVVPTAQLVRVEGLAPALARHDGAVGGGDAVLEHGRTRGEEVGAAAHDGAHASALVRSHRHGDVEAVHEAHAVGGEVAVAVVDLQLGQGGGGGAAGAVALEAAAAVARGAGEGGAGVGAGGAGPDAAGPVGVRDGDGEVGERVEGEAAAAQVGVAGVGLDGRPHCVVAVVDEG